jgi:hypothetical protein
VRRWSNRTRGGGWLEEVMRAGGHFCIPRTDAVVRFVQSASGPKQPEDATIVRAVRETEKKRW